MFDIINKILSAYLAWLWFQVFAILAFIGGLVLLGLWLSC